jgi:hypothetical protein
MRVQEDHRRDSLVNSPPLRPECAEISDRMRARCCDF